MKRLLVIFTLIAAATAYAASQKAPKAPPPEAYYPCFFIQNPVTCAAKSWGQCVWRDNACVPAN